MVRGIKEGVDWYRRTLAYASGLFYLFVMSITQLNF